MKKKARESRPWWVRLAVGGLRSRTVALLCLWLAVCVTLAGLVGGFLVHAWLFLGLVFLPAIPWYWLGIRWVDDNSKWDAAPLHSARQPLGS